MKTYTKEKIFIVIAIAFVLICLILLAVIIKQRSDSSSDTSTDVFTDDEVVSFDTIIYDDNISEPIYEGMPEGVFYTSVSTRTVLNTDNGSVLALKYPVFAGFSGVDTDYNLNDLILFQIDKMRRLTADGFYSRLSSGAKVVYEITNFEIGYADDRFISIRFEGYYDVQDENAYIDTGSKTVAYSMNIDIANMQILTNEQLYADFYALKRRFTNGNLALKYGDEHLLDNASYSDLFSQYNDKYTIYPDIYFTKDTVNVIILLNSDLGGSAVFTDSLNGSKEYINTYLAALITLLS